MKTKIYKVLSIMLALAMIFTTCICAFGTVSAAEGNTYYVSAAGNDEYAGTSADVPVTSVAKAIELATAAGATDTVTVKVIGETVTLGTLPVYTFDLVVEPNDPAVKTSIAGTGIFANNEGKTTTYNNVIVNSGGTWKNMYAASSNLLMENGAEFAGSFLTVASGTGNDGSAAKSVAGQTMKVGAGVYLINLSNLSWAKRTYTEDYNLEITGGNPFVGFNAYSGGKVNGTTTFQKNLNIAIKNATGIRFDQLENVTFEGAIQIIDSANLGFDKTYESSVSAYADPSMKDALAAVEADKYFITNDTGVKDLLKFTGEAGKYEVNTVKYNVTATPVGEGEPVVAADGFLTVAPGEYTISLTKNPEEFTYFAQAGATDGDGTEAAPFATVGEVIDAAVEKGYTTGDTITLNILGTTEVPWGTLNAYGFELVITSADGTGIVGNGASASAYMQGDVTFDNITVSFGNKYKNIGANGHNVTFTANAKQGGSRVESGFVIGSSGNPVYNKPFNVEINAANMVTYVYVQEYSSPTFNDDVNVKYNAATDANFYFGTSNGTGKYNAAYNIEIEKANSIAFPYRTDKMFEKAVFGENGYAQILNHTSNVVAPAETNSLYYVDAQKLYIYNNEVGAEYISLTDEAGVLDVTYTDAKKYVVAVDAEGNITKAQDGKLELDAGVYTIKLSKEPETDTYYVGTLDDPEIATYATVADAITAANADGYMDTDTITIKVLGATAEMGTLPAYTFDLIVEGEEITVPADPEVEGSVETVTYTVINVSDAIANNKGKTTKYENVVLNKTSQWSRFSLSYSNLVMGENATFTGSFETLVAGILGDDLGAGQTINGLNIELNGNAPYATTLSGFNYNNAIHNGNINLTLNLKTGGTRIGFNAYYNGEPRGSTTYNGDIVLNLKKTTSIEFINFGNATFNGDLFIMNEAGLKLNDEIPGYADLPDEKYVINNATGIKDILVPTLEFEGEFKVNFDSDVEKVVVIAADGTPYEANEDGYVNLNDYGVYDVDIQCIEHLYDYDCDKECNRCKETRDADHLFENYEDKDPAECGKDATEIAYCSYGCGAEDIVVVEGTALTHSHTTYVDKDPAECGKNATKIAYCDHGCGTEDIVEVEGTALAHEYDNACDKDCNLCSEIRPVPDHQYDNACDKDCNVCNDIRTVPAHKYDNDCDKTCNVCNDIRTVPDHRYNNACDKNCNVCNDIRTVPDHQYDNACDKDCNVCNAARTVGAHKYDNDCDKNCNVCNATRTVGAHKYDNDCDKNCNVCNAARTVGAHKYDNDCDKNCNVCNATRKVPAHKYDNACDKNCNVCNAARTVGAHKYTNACDKDCNVCKAVRTVPAHKYTNACDKTCNVCNANRTVPAHKYSHAADTTCNVCNAKRTVKGVHLIKEGSKQYYYKDGVKQTKVTELVKINGKWLYIQKGVWATNVDTLHKINGKWFLIKGGVWKATTGLVEYKGKTFYVIGGKWQSRTGVYKINGKYLYISGGKWNNKVNNLVKYQGKYFLIKSGKWANTTTTLYKKSGKYFYIKSGKWASTATAIVKYNGKQFFVKNGTAQLKFSGKVKVGGKTYTIKAGKVA